MALPDIPVVVESDPARSEPGTRASGRARKLESRLRGLVGKAIGDFGMIDDGDLVMVCLSGARTRTRSCTC